MDTQRLWIYELIYTGHIYIYTYAYIYVCMYIYIYVCTPFSRHALLQPAITNQVDVDPVDVDPSIAPPVTTAAGLRRQELQALVITVASIH